MPTFADLTINSKIIWEIKDSSNTKLFNQTHFLSSSYEKIVIVFPSQVAIKRYINENEHKSTFNSRIDAYRIGNSHYCKCCSK